MPTLNKEATERSTYVITASFKDEDGSIVLPKSIKWTLTDGKGRVINNRKKVSITPNTTVNIVLSGEDLAVEGGSDSRVLTVEARYNSNAGTNLPLRDSVSFKIKHAAITQGIIF